MAIESALADLFGSLQVTSRAEIDKVFSITPEGRHLPTIHPYKAASPPHSPARYINFIKCSHAF
ncbi:hypothetical protein HUW51_17775 [Adhaeribacter swui]|uniref:Uncharacterized protein n=1 Tax=Adhaeribacter swui TaxID=2086471 RepID=A0A7G7GBF1_9BACT|nr:hypothetical protein HUW51_17775 [Adhaeribacter swui]